MPVSSHSSQSKHSPAPEEKLKIRHSLQESAVHSSKQSIISHEKSKHYCTDTSNRMKMQAERVCSKQSRNAGIKN
ncbi:hypothetical protein PPL_06269 [Heterostelium album PN500]|uniref:Uncharacterized protein n=1 Tax=Heterostelium pallidum (strain ATCC 26659 / Pp 5 / PN500) TaxID=670386 RepID=D3BCP3_HETP5|nr:hypothetical protein PPL_06269 [Heterostelium album PN500]EFA80685.1 hypothetical protein PPL_06269 [Heterostelium album PN500]|eukprot:XP_020432805.1 hypothetical protein PPL_06269 [Heterostelium album PN500]